MPFFLHSALVTLIAASNRNLQEVSQMPRRVWTYSFFSLLLLLGLCIYADYGLSWDEDLSRATGMVSLRYVAEKFSPSLVAYHQDGTYPPLHAWANREYGVFLKPRPVCLSGCCILKTRAHGIVCGIYSRFWWGLAAW